MVLARPLVVPVRLFKCNLLILPKLPLKIALTFLLFSGISSFEVVISFLHRFLVFVLV